jgi:multiple sugar transport system permease protein
VTRAAVGRIGGTVLVHAVLAAGAVVTLAPLAWMAAASLMPAGQATVYPPRFLPHPATFDNYRTLFTRLDLARNLVNSVIIALSATALSTLINSLAGYAFAKFRFRGRDMTFRVLLAGLVIPAQVGMLPLFVMMRELHLVNSYWGVIVPSMASIFGIFLIRQYAMSIPDELLDAARIDGASEFTIYWRIVLPLLVPILATFAVFTFMSTWNDFLWPLIILSDDAKYTLPVALANLAGEHVQDTELMMAGSLVTLLPVLLAFVALQRFYIRGITTGSVKG